MSTGFTPSPRAAAAGVAAATVLCLWGAFESYGFEAAYHQQYRDPYMISAQSARFAGAMAAIPERAEVGYITDAGAGSVVDTAMFLSAQYAMAPRLLKRGAAEELVLGNFTHPFDYVAMGRSQGLELQQDFGQGVILFRKVAKR